MSPDQSSDGRAGSATPRSRAQDATLRPAFVLLFAVELDHPVASPPALPPGIVPLPAASSEAFLAQLAVFESRFLGRDYAAAARTRRFSVGRVTLRDTVGGPVPEQADVYLLAHVTGVTLWEAWMPAPMQPLDVARWIGWLDVEEDEDESLATRLWHALRPLSQTVGGNAAFTSYFPISILRAPATPLAELQEERREDIVRLLFLDRSRRHLKAGLIAEEINRDYCGREGGLTLLARRSGLDLHGAEDLLDEEAPGLPPKSALPFVLTVEQLLIERAVLKRLHGRLSHTMPPSIEALLATKQPVLDGLEEYYGAITSVNRFSDAVAADGERLLGIVDLYEAVMDRLDAVSFAIPTRYQKRMTLLQFWLTVVFGATEIGFIASGIATWYYRAELWAVLGWTVGASAVTGLALVLLLRGKVE